MSLFHHEDPAGGPMPPLDPMKVKPATGRGIALAIVVAIVFAVLWAHWSACEPAEQFKCLWSE